MRRVAARLVPKELNFLQKQYHEQVSLDMLDRSNYDLTFMQRIIIVDETLVYEFDMQTGQQSSRSRIKYDPKPKTTSKLLKSQGDHHCFLQYSWFAASQIRSREIDGQ